MSWICKCIIIVLKFYFPLFFAPLWDKISNAAAIQTIWIWAVSGVFAMSTSCHGLFTAEVKARVVYGLVQSRFLANDGEGGSDQPPKDSPGRNLSCIQDDAFNCTSRNQNLGWCFFG